MPETKKELCTLKNPDTNTTDEFYVLQAGCTACVCLLVDKVLYCANAGDSRCVLSSNKEVVEMSHDHKPLNEEEKKRIEAAGGYVTGDNRVCGNLNLSRAIGDLEFKTD